MMKQTNKISFIFFCTVLMVACTQKKDSLTTTVCDPNISFKNQVQPIILANCTTAGCHDGNNLPYIGDYQIMHDAANQIKNAVSKGIMPINKKLSAADINTIVCWINNGAKNN